MASFSGTVEILGGVQIVAGVPPATLPIDMPSLYAVRLTSLPSGVTLPLKMLDLWVVESRFSPMPTGDLTSSLQMLYAPMWTEGAYLPLPLFSGRQFPSTLYIRPNPVLIGTEMIWYYENYA